MCGGRGGGGGGSGWDGVGGLLVGKGRGRVRQANRKQENTSHVSIAFS